MFRETQMGCYWMWCLLLETNIAAGFTNILLKQKKGQAIPGKKKLLSKTSNNKTKKPNKQT